MTTLIDTKLTDPLAALHTLAELFSWRVKHTPLASAYLRYDENGERWMPISWQAIGDQVERIVHALAAMRLARGARIAILLPNGIDAVAVDQAALALACVPVPMHALDNPASIAYVLADSEASVLVAQSSAQWQAIAAVGMALPALRQVVIMDTTGLAPAIGAEHPVLAFQDWLIARTDGEPGLRYVPRHDDLAALVYTSGTTGKPKGVMLTHENVLENVKATMQRVAPRADDVFLSFLPLSHTFERTAGYYLPIASGSCVAHSRSASRLPAEMKAVRPTILISVPRIYERVHGVIEAKLAASSLKLRLFAMAQSVGWRRFCRAQQLAVPDGAPAWLDELIWPLLDKLVASNIRAQFGGRLRLAVSGGAALPQAIARCFLALGVPLLQGYGMTETSPVVAANGLDDNDPATIGRALAGVEVRIGEMQELQVRGRSVMRGYWKREADTAAAFIDGWLRTGDQAVIENGRLRILGRIKEIIVTSTGEKIAPSDLEQAITSSPVFDQAYAFGDNRPFIACVVVLSQAGWAAMASELDLDPEAADSLRAPAAAALALERIRELTKGFPHYAQPRAVALTREPWSSENSLLTPTLKLKRLNLANHFAADIERLYQR
ncbi:long-chain fatty acid--CoA ligase [Massilia antarctica]|uniref:Long-chain fatty acid--CoA ligase n=1 Tax=Massilia antarctica TaxID=2765360 RepID=A0AA48WCZ8_9BURK|nr:long-chain fatty acid--CoA ligase [Massilia antarctica]QPI48985.1 long-chain fatty acid--CoA ligase [Massilia antarctica]